MNESFEKPLGVQEPCHEDLMDEAIMQGDVITFVNAYKKTLLGVEITPAGIYVKKHINDFATTHRGPRLVQKLVKVELITDLMHEIFSNEASFEARDAVSFRNVRPNASHQEESALQRHQRWLDKTGRLILAQNKFGMEAMFLLGQQLLSVTREDES